MKNLFWTLFIGVVFFSCSTAKKATQETATLPEVENSLLWEISGKGLSEPSYLFGTIHMIDKEDFVLTEKTKSSIDKTKRVTFEINMEDMMDVSNLMPLMMKSFMNNDTTLKDLVTATEYDMIKAHFEKMGLPMMFIDRIKPMFLTVMTGGDDLSSFGQSDGQMVSYEMEIMEVAKGKNMSIAGLETAEYQMSMFDSIPYGVQAKMLVESVQTGSEGTAGADEFDELVKMYKAQDIGAMVGLMEEDPQGLGKYENLLLANRNKNWIPVMAKMMVETPTFFAVGAGHLAGAEGVVTLLRKEGYKVTPLYQ
jgi:uncharacterized protein YbaP (TraB family)